VKAGLIDKRFAEIIRKAREATDFSQVRLAEQMVTLGHPWAQQTATRAERGVRVISLAEAVALAEILHFDAQLSELARGPLCDVCKDMPPQGFTCNTCGRSGS